MPDLLPYPYYPYIITSRSIRMKSSYSPNSGAAALFCIVKYKDAVHQVDKLTAQIAKDQAQASEAARENERLMSRSLAIIATTHQKELQDEKSKRDQFINSVRTCTVRLSIPVQACSTSAGTNTPTSPGNSPETRAHLTPEAGATLAAIAADGDDASHIS
ncbi:hypothetical protein UNDKW_2275 [Undibacterium sp. KW1]|uniref:lysis system i-spanin subunit Rz n=1 Tax=Undibacterium sp. KW1 TaxID=2058624 RepID=UPI001331EC51|nr:lysis system i-spanin subunit Rz [Undibacterium sp. KW1]BBB60548.1 hypothetical protein UNDKW_2275 [Undibacterium sp. KW1]